jgi:hypothetical protein
MKPFRITIRDNALKGGVLRYIEGLPIDKAWVVTVEREKKRRTDSQNNTMWMWHAIVANETGNTPDDIHEAVKDILLPPKIVTIGDEEKEVRSTKRMKRQEFSDFLMQYHAWAASTLNIHLPHPEDHGREERYGT